MKTLARTLRRTAKALLLTVALAALALWSSTRHQTRYVTFAWHTLQPNAADDCELTIGGGKGRIFLQWQQLHYKVQKHRDYVASQPRLSCDFLADEFTWDDHDFFHKFGPIHWWADDGTWSRTPAKWRSLNTPYWLIISLS